MYELKVSDVRLWVHLGCSEQEQYRPQGVSLDFTFLFSSMPKGASSDKIEDTVCYFTAIQIATKVLDNKKFHLIEHVSKCVYDAIMEELLSNQSVKLIVKATKLSPPVANLHGGVSFTVYE